MTLPGLVADRSGQGPADWKEPMSDLTEVLHTDHERIAGLFDDFVERPDPALVREICGRLVAHTAAEEDLVYNVVSQLDRSVATRFREHHRRIDQVVAMINTGSPRDDDWSELVIDLRDLVGEHIAAEERETFALLHDAAGDKWHEEVGATVRARLGLRPPFEAPT